MHRKKKTIKREIVSLCTVVKNCCTNIICDLHSYWVGKIQLSQQTRQVCNEIENRLTGEKYKKYIVCKLYALRRQTSFFILYSV